MLCSFVLIVEPHWILGTYGNIVHVSITIFRIFQFLEAYEKEFILHSYNSLR
jgi:hypothetical protein